MISILQEFSSTGLEFDKTTQSLTALPFDLDNSFFKANTYATVRTINSVLDKLHYNLMYLYRGCSIGSFSVFDTFLYSISSSKVGPGFFSIENNYAPTDISQSSLSGSRLGLSLSFDVSTNGSYLLYSTGNNIACLFTSRFQNRVVFNTRDVDPLSGDIKFNDIVDIKTDFKENLYVFDRAYNNLYQYNISNFVSRENIYREKLFIKNLVGGKSDSDQNNKFDEVKNLAVNENFVVVQDYGIKGFKVFDKNLNWLGTYVFKKLFDRYNFFSAMSLTTDNVLVCGEGSSIVKLVLTKSDLKLSGEFFVGSFFGEGETIKSISLSPANKNILYIQTNFAIKKAWTTNLGYILGEFNYENATNVDIRWLSVSPYDELNDLVILYSFIDNKEQLSVNKDSVTLNSLLNVLDFEIYSIDEIRANKEEYIQSWVILKSLQKIYYNTFILLQNIKYRFLERDSVQYPIIYKKIYNEKFLGFSENIDFDVNFNIGLNEIFQSEVFNRCVKSVLELQKIILVFIINNENNKIYLSPEPEKGAPNVKKYLYFADDSIILTPNPGNLDIFQELEPAGGILTSLGGAPYTGIGGISITEGVNI